MMNDVLIPRSGGRGRLIYSPKHPDPLKRPTMGIQPHPTPQLRMRDI